MNKVELKLGDSSEILKTIADESIDLTITSPPYDNLRTYDNTLVWNFDIFKNIANELYRVTKVGGVIIWVVGDATINGSETGTSFRQALYFKEIGFNIHDTMLYKKENHLPLKHNRYEQDFEYMFCFSKGKPKTFNPIEIPCKLAGQEFWGDSKVFKTAGQSVNIGRGIVKDTKYHGNIFSYRTGSIVNDGSEHPAPFPEQLVYDQMISWSNEGDTVLDCFLGSGTTGKVAVELRRNFIGIEKVESYLNGAKNRINNAIENNKYQQKDLFL